MKVASVAPAAIREETPLLFPRKSQTDGSPPEKKAKTPESGQEKKVRPQIKVYKPG